MKNSKEERVMRSVADLFPKWIEIKSIMRADPPRPDIQCKLQDGSTAYFEIAECIDTTASKEARRRDKIEALFERRLEDHPRRTALEQKYWSSTVHVRLHTSATERQIGAAVPQILDFLYDRPRVDHFLSFSDSVEHTSLARVAEGIQVFGHSLNERHNFAFERALAVVPAEKLISESIDRKLSKT